MTAKAAEKKSEPMPPSRLERIEETVTNVWNKLAEQDAKREAVVSTVKPPYTEADALRACIRALDELPDRSRYGNSGLDYGGKDTATIARILRYVSDRFGVALIEHRELPCSRLHVEEASQEVLLAALRGVPFSS